MKLIPNIEIPTTLFLSALLITAFAVNAEAVQPDNNFGKDVDTEKTSAPKTTTTVTAKPAEVKTITKNKAHKTKKAKKKVNK